MVFDFKFWQFLTNPHRLAVQQQTSTMRGFKKRVAAVLLIGILLFAIREIWGMNTESLTSLLSTMTTTDYTIARYTSLAVAIIWSLLYMSFHFWGVAYILSAVTSIPFKKLLPLQLLIIGLLLIEKALVFLVFTMTSATANVSFLSFGPLAVTFLDNWYLILFLNQLTVTTALIISLQYRFIRSYPSDNNWHRMLPVLIGIHVAMALVTAAIGFIPIDTWFDGIIGRGVGQ